MSARRVAMQRLRRAIAMILLAVALTVGPGAPTPPARAETADPCLPGPGPEAGALAGRRVLRDYPEGGDGTALAAARAAAARLATPDAGPCTRYDLGRFYLRTGDYDLAAEQLRAALAGQDQVPGFDSLAAWNALGYAQLQTGALDAAAASFQTQRAQADRIPPEARIKTLNNLGYTQMLAGQYDLAEATLAEAEAAGSLLATRNLEVLASIRATIGAKDPDIPGTFGAVVASARSEETARQELARMRDRLAGATAATGPETGTGTGTGTGAGAMRRLSIFRMGNGSFSIVVAPYSSYPKAEELRRAAVTAGLAGAYVSSLGQWEDVTARLLPPQDG
ncbi:tetratricopeptide repeat protein [Frigidibacter sp. MR17.24]|uniref:tetratricopeptide repeat protein n=1 Tax=Frigidibacter sp. MR17.24 TaxID=3127345 RepID=UPI003012ABE5